MSLAATGSGLLALTDEVSVTGRTRGAAGGCLTVTVTTHDRPGARTAEGRPCR